MPLPKEIFANDGDDQFHPAAELSGIILDRTGHPGPGHRRLVAEANSARLRMMERLAGYWGCRESRIPELIAQLSKLGLLGGINRNALDATMLSYWRARQEGLDHDAAANRAMQTIDGGIVVTGTHRPQHAA
jgi:hypothetical protein